MKSSEWIKVLESEVEKRFAEEKHKPNGFEDSAPSIKLGILSDMYEVEPMDISIHKELAYDKLATMYATQAAWN
jgi:hypothetical protein